MKTRLYHPTLPRRFVDVSEGSVERHLKAGWSRTPLMPTKAGEEPPPPDRDPTAPPAGNASKQAWIDYAVLRGADRDDADAMTRDELRDVYTPTE